MTALPAPHPRPTLRVVPPPGQPKTPARPVKDFHYYARLEPRLLLLEDAAWQIVDRYAKRPGWCPYTWYFPGASQKHGHHRLGFRQLVNHLAGWHSPTRGVQGNNAYDVVGRHIRAVLDRHPCRHTDRYPCTYTSQGKHVPMEMQRLCKHLGIRDLFDPRPSVYHSDDERRTMVLRDPAEFAEWDARNRQEARHG